MTAAAALPSVDRPAVETRPKPALRLTYLDGLRGLAAFWVVLCHVYATVQGPWNNGHVPGRALALLAWMGSGGHLAVNIFIVLSGYCLMLPIVRSERGQLAGGLPGFFRRRALRILPPYYAALAVSLLLIALVPALGTVANSRFDLSYWNQQALPVFRTDVILSHLLLVHNVSLQWKSKIDYPMWSVATEWQIYFVFGLLLLPVWRRFGMGITLAAALCLGAVPHFVLHNDDACFHFLFSFALGMAAARLNFGSGRRFELKPLSLTAAFLWVITLAITVFKSGWFGRHMLPMDLFTGTATAVLLVFCTQSLMQERSPWILRLFQWRGAVFTGTISYSLYLIHALVIALLHSYVQAHQLNWMISYALLLGIGAPLCLFIAYLFHLVFEKPFMNMQKKTPRVMFATPSFRNDT